MKEYYMEQRSPEWYEMRKLKLTASDASTILAMGKGLETLIGEKLAEYYSSGNYEEYTDSFTNKHIQRGVEFEEKAKSIYELETGLTVKNVGLVVFNEHIACSPDGLVGDDGLIEIKNHSDKVFLNLLETGKIDKKYYNQIQMQLYVTGRQWCDYFGFNPNFEPCYFKLRIYPDADVFERFNEAFPHAVANMLQRKKAIDELLQKSVA
jgi:putative phage-type endonuclease